MEIPEDVMKVAREIAGDWAVNTRELDALSGSIAGAILAERERCAKIPESWVGCEAITAAIRAAPPA